MKNKLPIKNLFSAGAILSVFSLSAGAAVTEFEITGTSDAPTFANLNSPKEILLSNGSGTGAAVYGNYNDRIINKTSFEIAANVHFTATSNLTTTIFNMGSGSSFTIGTAGARGGMSIFPSGSSSQTSLIDGAIDVYGSMTATSGSFSNDRYIFSIGYNNNTLYSPNVTFGANATLHSNGVLGAYNNTSRSINRMISGKNKAYLSIGTSSGQVAEGALVFDDFFYFAGSTVLKLYSTNAIISGAAVESVAANVEAGFANATSQADSTFFVVSADGTAGGDFTINSFVSNEIGTIIANSASSIKLISEVLDGSAGKDSLVVHNIKVLDDGSGNKTLTLLLNFNESRDSMCLENFYELIADADVAVQVYNHSTAEYEAGELGVNYAVSADGWITSVPVPEPAHFALLFGALALAYCRRK